MTESSGASSAIATGAAAGEVTTSIRPGSGAPEGRRNSTAARAAAAAAPSAAPHGSRRTLCGSAVCGSASPMRSQSVSEGFSSRFSSRSRTDPVQSLFIFLAIELYVFLDLVCQQGPCPEVL